MPILSQIILVFSFFILLMGQTVSAALALTITPALTDLSVDMGERTEFTVTLLNDEQETTTILLESADARFTLEGIPLFLDIGNIPPDSLTWWLSYEPGPYKLEPGEEKEIPITISIPERATPGGHYGAILVSRGATAEEEKPVTIKLQSKVASLLFANVAGEVDRSFSIADFSSKEKIYRSFPVSFEVQLSNDGNTHLQPHGTIDISGGLWPAKTKERLLVNEDFAYLFPETGRTFTVEWKKKSPSPFWPLYLGKYTASLELKAVEVPLIAAKASFWIVPMPAILVLAATLLVVFLGLRYYTRRLIQQFETP